MTERFPEYGRGDLAKRSLAQLVARLGVGDTAVRMTTQGTHKAFVTGPAADDDAASSDALTAKQEAFALAWAETGNQAAAYRRVYNVHPKTLPQSVWESASRIAALPHVRKRYNEHRQQLALETLCSVHEALQWQLDIATADPNEVAYVAKRACRHCYGFNHAYQWTDVDEYTDACVKAIDNKGQPPSCSGGYGYNRALDPVPTCPNCLGDGYSETVINDTRNLSGKARKLYKGIDIKNGALVVTMHDQQKAWEMVCRMLGAFNDKLKLDLPGAAKAGKMPEGLSEAEAARHYLTLIG